LSRAGGRGGFGAQIQAVDYVTHIMEQVSPSAQEWAYRSARAWAARRKVDADVGAGSRRVYRYSLVQA
jgi:hypothetical protein